MNPAWMAWPQTQVLIAAFGDAPLRFVGGCVRDALLERPVTDVDAATPFLPDAVMALLQKAGIKAIPTGIAHGTVTALIDGKHFEITTLRKDISTDGRHATVSYTDDWQQDAARRDFTMNAMYLSPTGELFDYYDGAADARAGRVRFIGDASQRIAEDYLRVLRFFRFYAHYGKGEPDAVALAACAAAADHLDTLSGERIQQEMFKLLAVSSAPVLLLMHKAGVLDHVLGIRVDTDIVERLEKQSPDAGPLEKLAALLSSLPNPMDAVRPVTARMKLSGAMTRQLQMIVEEQMHVTASLPLPEQKKLLRRAGVEIFIAAVAVSAARSAFDPEAMLRLPKQWQPPTFPITGDDLIAQGVKPGKEMGELLRRLEEEWEANDYAVTKEELLARY